MVCNCENCEKLVSIVMPVYKTEKYLVGAIESVLSQTHHNFELILVDDGSPDNSLQICNQYAKQDVRISAYHQRNAGLSAARNTGIHLASGEFIIFLDSDDQLINNAIEKMLELAIDDVDAVIPDRYIKVMEANGSQEVAMHFLRKQQISDPVSFAFETIIGQGRAWRASALLYRLSIIHNNKIVFPVGYTAEDIIFNLLFMQRAKKLSFYNNATVLNLKRNGSITMTYRPSFYPTICFIDDTCRRFAQNYGEKPEHEQQIRSLFLRNVILYVIETVSPRNMEMSFQQKWSESLTILKERRTQEACCGKLTPPFFCGKAKRLYMSLAFFLLRQHAIHVTILLAALGSTFRKG